jgi:hypothetical protein
VLGRQVLYYLDYLPSALSPFYRRKKKKKPQKPEAQRSKVVCLGSHSSTSQGQDLTDGRPSGLEHILPAMVTVIPPTLENHNRRSTKPSLLFYQLTIHFGRENPDMIKRN